LLLGPSLPMGKPELLIKPVNLEIIKPGLLLYSREINLFLFPLRDILEVLTIDGVFYLPNQNKAPVRQFLRCIPPKIGADIVILCDLRPLT
jgi:hypothetical protein